MLQPSGMRCLFTFLMLIAFCVPAGAGLQRSGLRAAMAAGLVKVSAAATGAVYHGKALRLRLVNTTRDSLHVTVDPALIFRPGDTSFQDLVLAGAEILTLAPAGTAELSVQTFCGKASALAPGAKLDYAFIRQGDSAMIRLLHHIRQQSLFDALGQQAVWVLTDNHSLEGVIDPARPKKSSDLVALLVSITGRGVPPYFKYYKLGTVAGQPVFEKRVLKIVAKLDWTLTEPRPLSLGIFNERGEEVQPVFREQLLNKGHFKMQVEFEGEGAPPGRYFMRLSDGGKVLRELVVTVE